MSSAIRPVGSTARRHAATAVATAGLVAVAGLAYVKWLPYYHRILTVSVTHSLGPSLFGPQGYFAAANLDAAWTYTVKYFRAVWQAALLGIVLGGAVEALLPTPWIRRFLAGSSPRTVLLAGICALPGMMCSCCASPVVAGLRRRHASAGAALAFWLGNPVLNPATLAVLILVLGWQFGLIRLAFGAVMVFGIGFLVDRFFPDENRPPEAVPAPLEAEAGGARSGSWAIRWLQASGRLAAWIVPEYLVMVLVTGLLGGVFFPAGLGGWADSPVALPLIALAGTLFVIPTMAEIPIVQGLMAAGLPVGPAAALLLTLPAVSLPGLVILGRSFRARTLAAVTLAVTLVGVAAGAVAAALL
ncbi:MAG TPA: permease [Thermaerobacter sp.]